MPKGIIFVAAGGRGVRLWSDLPELKASGLPKSLGLVIKNRPLLAYQLDILTKLPNYQIILSFNHRRSIHVFQEYVRKGTIPQYNYLLNQHTYRKKIATIDMFKVSGPHKPWEDSFETIIITCGDVYFDPQHAAQLIQTHKSDNCSIQTLCDFAEHMVTLNTHFHPVYNKNGELKYIKESSRIPSEIICHPQFLTESAFRIYYKMREGVTKSEFTNIALKKGERFKVIRPKEYVNVNFPQDFKKAIDLLSS